MDSPVFHYAVALFDIAKEEGKIVSYLEDAKVLSEVINENKELIKLLSSYFLNEDEKNEIIDNSFSLLNEVNVKNLLKLITANHMVSKLDDLLDEFIEMCNESLGVKKGKLYSTKELSKEEIAKIESAFDSKLNIKVQLENIVDTSLIGGVRVVINDHVYDGSLKNQLESLKSSLKKEGVN